MREKQKVRERGREKIMKEGEIESGKREEKEKKSAGQNARKKYKKKTSKREKEEQVVVFWFVRISENGREKKRL